MLKIKINSSWITAFVLLLLFTFIYLVVNFYQTALHKSKLTHQRQQLEMVKSAAGGMSHYLAHLQNDLEIWSSFYPADLMAHVFHPEMPEGAVQSIFLINDRLQIVYQHGNPLPRWIADELQQAARSMSTAGDKTDAAHPYWYSPVQPMDSNAADSGYVFMILSPGKVKSPADIQSGTVYAGYIINFDWLIEKFISPLRLSENDFAWILDDQGRLIYHPNHSEMLLRSVKEMNQACLTCHQTFDVQQNMLTKESGLDEYIISGEPSKIMAFTSIQAGQQKWTLAISTFLPWVVRDVLDTFLIVFILSAVFLLLLVLAGIILYIINLKRVRAEEAERHITQAQSYQEKLNQAAKLASIGELVDSVAHEINTPTGIIATVTDTLLLQDCAKLNCAADLNVLHDQVKRIKKYTKGLLGFSRRLSFQPERDNLPDLIDECIFLVSPRLRSHRITITKNFPDNLQQFIFDRARIEQVVINLLNNAIDFVDRDGKIQIDLQIKPAENGRDYNQWICIAISDNGKGIPADDLPFLFEPFFSTKPISKGTGLGLAISKTIVERHNGKITVKSRPGQGSTFSVYLPFLNT